MTTLDLVLDRVAELEAADVRDDELFARRVVTQIRTAPPKRRRFVGRPAAIAVAVGVLVTGGAVAALVRTAIPERRPAPRASAGVVAEDGRRAATAAPTVGVKVSARPEAKAATAGSMRRTYRKDDLEWGYTSETLAYALDHRSGLRLETNTHDTAFRTGVPHKVTLDLSNTGKYAIAISSRDCALAVLTFRVDGGSPTGSQETSQCTESAAGGQKFVLAPGERRTVHYAVVLPSSGIWAVRGTCRCGYDRVDQAPSGSTVEDLGQLGVPGPVGPLGPELSSPPKGLTTPPIRVRAS